MALAGVAIYYIIKFISTFACLKLLFTIVVPLLLILLIGIKIDEFIDEL